VSTPAAAAARCRAARRGLAKSGITSPVVVVWDWLSRAEVRLQVTCLEPSPGFGAVSGSPSGAVSFSVVKTTGWLQALLNRGARYRPEESPHPEPFAPESMSLLELGRLLAGPGYSERVASAYVEVVTFASADEIVAMLEVMLEEDWMLFRSGRETSRSGWPASNGQRMSNCCAWRPATYMPSVPTGMP
jgi:hypothetical protein